MLALDDPLDEDIFETIVFRNNRGVGQEGINISVSNFGKADLNLSIGCGKWCDRGEGCWGGRGSRSTVGRHSQATQAEIRCCEASSRARAGAAR